MNVSQTLSQAGRKWQSNLPALEAEIAELKSKTRSELPTEYLDLLRFSNGGEGPLALEPLWFQLYPVKDCIEFCVDTESGKRFPEFLFFGSNGGLESIAFNLREGPPWPIVMVDPIAGAESATIIAHNIAEFISAMGVESGEA